MKNKRERLSLIQQHVSKFLKRHHYKLVSFLEKEEYIPGERNTNANDNIFFLLGSHLPKSDNKEKI